MIWEITGLAAGISGAVFILVDIVMVHMLYETKRTPSQCFLIWFCCFTCIIFLHLIPNPYLNFPLSQEVLAVISCVLLVGYFILFPQVSKKELLFSFLFINNVLCLIFLFARTFTALFSASMDLAVANQLFLNVYLIGATFFLTVFALELRPVILKCLSAYKENIFNLLSFSLSNYIALLLLSSIGRAWHLPDYELVIRNFVILVVEIAGYMLAFNALTSLAEKLIVEAETKVTKEQLVLSNQYYDGLTNKVHQMRMYNHNMRYIVKGLSALHEQKDYEGMSAFISTLEDELPQSLPIWSHVPEIDAVIASCAESCQKENINFQCDFSLPRETGIDRLHMCIMLGNCLQNALDACRRMDPSEPRYIRLVCFPAMKKIVIHVENSFDGVIKKNEEGILLSRKEDEQNLHGFGVASVQSTAEKYHGNCAWEAKNKCFRMNVLLSPDN